MPKPKLDKAAFQVALDRQWQRYGLAGAREMTPLQWWQAVSTAVNECLPLQPLPDGVSGTWTLIEESGRQHHG
ncbi:hypothetical protein [Sodalis glossinidius]|uniref:hypothetical protein n=1 Tax=Sodalis glossinidius TaxID=63612 RepID=UPI0002F4044E|nr:hypothetical protein [Sodalis glossinidius]